MTIKTLADCLTVIAIIICSISAIICGLKDNIGLCLLNLALIAYNVFLFYSRRD